MTKDEYHEFGARISIVNLTPDEEFLLLVQLAVLRYLEAHEAQQIEAVIPDSTPLKPMLEALKGQGSKALRDGLERVIAEYEATRQKSRKAIKQWEEFKKLRKEKGEASLFD